MNRLPVIKCKNKACMLNEGLECSSPCRDREDFSCLSMDVDKPLNKEGEELKKQLRTQSWRDTLGLSKFE